MRFLASVTVLLAPALAGAHIHMTSPLSRTDDATGNPQKTEHCGGNPGRIASRVQVLRPGQPVTITWAETINHPGHFRIAFQQNGETFGIPPAAPGPCITPAGGTVACPSGVTDCAWPTANQEGVDPVNGSIVLKDLITDGMLSTEVIMPNIECDNCTLQFIQVMNDKCPYTTDTASDDIYFNCADITLSNTAPMVDAGVPPGDGGGSGSGSGSGSNNNGGDASGGCSTGSGAGLGAAFGLVALLRRRR